ncbi:MAG: cupredoxin domain-containing protein [Dehalococcoidia bacterium]|nr:cupredoxin domain-containing protein [Dehalococcoidia bacterium]
MLNRRRAGVGVVIAATVVMALALSSCGSGGYSGATSTQPAPTEAAAAAPSAMAGASPSAGATAASTGAGANGSTLLALRAENISFDKTSLTAPAGAVTIALNNQDTGVAHNIHLYRGSDASGASLGMTDVAIGPGTQELKAVLMPGTYFYECDVHPGQMKGTITVS